MFLYLYFICSCTRITCWFCMLYVFLEMISYCNILCSLLYSVHIVFRYVHIITEGSSLFIIASVEYPTELMYHCLLNLLLMEMLVVSLSLSLSPCFLQLQTTFQWMLLYVSPCVTYGRMSLYRGVEVLVPGLLHPHIHYILQNVLQDGCANL